VLGTHPRTLGTRHQLGRFLTRAQSHSEAVSGLEAVVAEQEVVHGPQHPRTLASRLDLVRAIHAAHGLASALSRRADLERDCAAALGTDHPLTRQIREYGNRSDSNR
jgi:hypothetical protein